MLVSPLDTGTMFQLHAQTGSEQRLLDIMRCQRVSREENVDVAAAKQLDHVLHATGVNDCRAADEQNFPARRASSSKFGGDLANGDPFGFFGGDAAGHEIEPARL